MSKKALIIVLILVVAIVFGGYKLYLTRMSGVSGLKVVSNPPANIFLDDKLIGKAPYDNRQSSGEHVLKLVPDDSVTSTASSWRGKIFLQPNILTFVKRDLGVSELTSSGEIVTMEGVTSSDAQLAVFSQPDSATIVFDGQEKGTTPFLIRDVVPGDHDVAVTSPGFIGRTIRVDAQAGYKISVNFQLALSGESDATSSAVVTPVQSSNKEPKKPYALIKDTPTGFLRVRSAVGTSASEVAQIKPGEKYSILEVKEDWYKINYIEDKEGWISSRYVQKID